MQEHIQTFKREDDSDGVGYVAAKGLSEEDVIRLKEISQRPLHERLENKVKPLTTNIQNLEERTAKLDQDRQKNQLDRKEIEAVDLDGSIDSNRVNQLRQYIQKDIQRLQQINQKTQEIDRDKQTINDALNNKELELQNKEREIEEYDNYFREAPPEKKNYYISEIKK